MREPDFTGLFERNSHPLADADGFGVLADDFGGHPHAGGAIDIDHREGKGHGHAGQSWLVVDRICKDRARSRHRVRRYVA